MHYTWSKQWKKNTFIQAFIMFIVIHKKNTVVEIKYTKNTYLEKKLPRNYLCRYNVPPNHRPVCSSISQHHCDPQDGHDFHKEIGNNMFTHINTMHPQSSQQSPQNTVNHLTDGFLGITLPGHHKDAHNNKMHMLGMTKNVFQPKMIWWMGKSTPGWETQIQQWFNGFT